MGQQVTYRCPGLRKIAHRRVQIHRQNRNCLSSGKCGVLLFPLSPEAFRKEPVSVYSWSIFPWEEGFVFRSWDQAIHWAHTLSARNKGALSMDLSVGSTKTLLHNAAMVDRFIAMSGKSPNMRLNGTDFKDFYSTAFAPRCNFYNFTELLLNGSATTSEVKVI